MFHIYVLYVFLNFLRLFDNAFSFLLQKKIDPISHSIVRVQKTRKSFNKAFKLFNSCLENSIEMLFNEGRG